MKRFVRSLGARRPSPADQALIAGILGNAESRLFWAQPVIDQAHAVDTARVVLDRGRPDLAAAALLHDVGKRHASLGVVGRSIASALSLMRFPVRGRYARYLEHAKAGARDLARAGSAPHVVEFARSHHGDRPPGFDATDWELLVAADNE
ncbi:MAG: HDIG domain-containing metalloprotein [Acidimicrobiia bacterium]